MSRSTIGALLYSLSAALFFVFIHFAPGIASGLTGFMIVGSLLLFNFKETTNFEKILIVTSVLFLGFTLFATFESENRHEAYTKLFLKIPVFLLPLLFCAAKKLNVKYLLWICISFITTTCIVSTLSVINYLINADVINQLILESKPVPVFTEVYHIQFSVFVAWGVMVAAFLMVFRNTFSLPNWLFRTVGVMGFLLFIGIHILTTRTGLVSFYGAAFTGIIGYIILYKKYKLIPWLLVFLVIPLAAIKMLPSLQNRMTNTVDDFNTVKTGANANDKSFGQRWEAWKTSLNLLKSNWLTGVGLGDVKLRMDEQYVKDQSLLTPENRKKPHNQFLETALQSGIISVALLLMLFVVPLFQRKNLFIWSFIALCFIAFQFESMLERQASLMFFVIFYALSFYVNTIDFSYKKSDTNR